MSSTNELRVLVLATERADADAVCTVSSEAGIVAEACLNMDALCSEITTGAGTAVIGQEVLSRASFDKLAATLRHQPAWSDFPVILIAFPTGGWTTTVEDVLGPSADQGNFVIVQRPLKVEILVSALRAALRARSRQYELRRSHELRCESEARFRTLVKASSQVLYRMSPDWGEMRQLTGGGFLADMPASTRNWLQEYIHPDDQPHVTAVIEEAIRTKSIFELEHRVRRLDGSLGWVSSRAIPLLDADGQITEWFGTASDITRRKQAEEALRGSENRLAADLEVMTRLRNISTLLMGERKIEDLLGEIVEAAIAISRADFGNIQLWDPESSKLRIAAHRGFPAWWIEYWNGVSKGEGVCGVAAQRQERVIVDDVEHSPIFTNGTSLAMQLKAGVRAVQSTPLISRSGAFLGMLSTHYREPHRPNSHTLQHLDLLARQAADLVERQQAEGKLRESEERYRNLFESMDEGFASCEMIYDETGQPADYRYLAVNPAFAKETGLPVSQIVGRTVRDVIPEIEQSWIETYGRIVRTGSSERFKHFSAPLGKHFELFAWRSGPGQFAVVFTDVTDRKAAEERLRLAAKLESVGMLAGGIAHDFNNLLTVIMGAASSTLDEYPSSESSKTVISAAERASQLTKQLLAYAGKGQFIKKPVEISALVARSRQLLEASVPKRIKLVFNLAKNLAAVEEDPSQIDQILMNLVINAGEAIEPKTDGRLEVSTGMSEVTPEAARLHSRFEVVPGVYVWLEVRDNGAGMDEATLSRIFDPFFSTKFTGRGLGLAAVDGIVRSSKGFIDVQSSPNRGSTFRVFLPASDKKRPTEVEAPAQRSEFRGVLTVLVVDDEEMVRKLACMILRQHGYEVLEANEGKHALQVLAESPSLPSHLLLDLAIPVMGGDELVPILNAQYPALKVIVTSGYPEEEVGKKFRDSSIAGFLQKPYTAVRLTDKVDQILGRAPRQPGQIIQFPNSAVG